MSQVRQNLRHYYSSEDSSSSSSSTATTIDNHQHHIHRSLIVHGESAPKGRFPYFVMVGDDCGGSLIAPDIVLTAGHCLPKHTIQSVLERKQHHHHHGHGHKNHTMTNTTTTTTTFEQQQLDEDDYDTLDWVRVGAESRYHLKHPTNEEEEDELSVGEFFWIQRATRHVQYHRYGEDEFIYDYSILQLNGTSSLPVVHLWRNNDDDDDDDAMMIPPPVIVTAIGMGWTHPDRPSKAHYLQQVDLHTVSYQDCANVTTSTTTKNDDDDDDDKEDEEEESYEGRIDATSHLCTLEPGKDSCAYDSGSPLIITTPQGEDILVAQVSWGMECADPLFPAVNARLTDPAILEWIHETVCDWSVDAPSAFGCYTTTNMEDGGGGDTTATVPTFSIPLLGNFDFVYLLLACILAACGSRMYWGRQRKRQDYVKL